MLLSEPAPKSQLWYLEEGTRTEKYQIKETETETQDRYRMSDGQYKTTQSLYRLRAEEEIKNKEQ